MQTKRVDNRIKPCFNDRVFIKFNIIITFLFAIIIVYPLLFVLFASFDSGSSTLTINIIPQKWTLEGYIAIFEYKWIWIGYRNSFLYTGVGAILGIVFCVCAAYPLSQSNLEGRRFLLSLFLFTMYFNGGLVPTFLTIRAYGLLDNPLAILLLGSVNIYHMIIMRTYFSSQIPRELKEASELDGCGEFEYLIRVALPLSIPIMAVIGLYYAVGFWNSYFDAMVFLSTRTKMPLSVFLRDILILNNTADITSSMDPDAMVSLQERQAVMKYSLIVVSSLPMFFLYPFVQRYFVEGIMIGSIKG